MYLRPRQGRKPSVMNSRRELSDSDSDDSSPPNKKKKTKGGRFVNRQTGKKPLEGVNSSGKGKSLRQNAPHPPAPFLSDEKVDLSDDDNKDADDNNDNDGHDDDKDNYNDVDNDYNNDDNSSDEAED